MNGDPRGGIYRDLVLSQVPRILGLGDREAGSATFGCFDRCYWHYKLIDVPNARFQEVSLLLALLYTRDFEGNVYVGNGRIREWAMGAIEFWMAARNKDGSVNEVYPYERSFCATSFGLYATTEALLCLASPMPPGLTRTADWLAGKSNPAVSNQMAAAAVGLYDVSLLTGSSQYRRAARRKIEALVAAQHPSGYFPEYGGADIGYQSITVGLLVKYAQRSQDEECRSVLGMAVKFLEEHIAEDGTFDDTRTSRRTQFLYPYGVRASGSIVAERHLRGLAKGLVVNPAWLDDRYVIPMATDFLEAYLEAPRCS